MTEEEAKNSRTNIRLMVILAIILTIGIILRRDFIASELKATFSAMFESNDSTKQSDDTAEKKGTNADKH